MITVQLTIAEARALVREDRDDKDFESAVWKINQEALELIEREYDAY